MDAVEQVVRNVWDQLPEPICSALSAVHIVITEKADELPDAPPDWNGRYVGTTIEADEDELIALPEGTLYLCAPNLKAEQDAMSVFLHEVGHALGLDEVEVADLGLE